MNIPTPSTLLSNYPLDHIGIVVENLDESIAFYQKAFGLQVSCREEIAERNIELVFLPLGNTDLELIAPTGPNSTVSKFLEERGPGLHHLCYKVTDLKAELIKFAAAGYEVLDPEPRQGARNSLIAFLHPKSMNGIITELLQYK